MGLIVEARYPVGFGEGLSFEPSARPGPVVVNEPEPQVDVDENGEPIPGPPEATPPPQKKAEDDPAVKKALELLAVKA